MYDLAKFLLFIASENSVRDLDELSKACFMKVERVVNSKGRKNIFLKKEKSEKPTQPDLFFEKIGENESSKLFSRVSYIGCCENENRALFIALYKFFIEEKIDQLSFSGHPVIEFGLCKSNVKIEPISLIYEWDLEKSVNEWDHLSQSSHHEFVYLKLNPVQGDTGIFFCDLTGLQYGVDEYHKVSDTASVPLMLGHSEDIMEVYADVYKDYKIFVSSENESQCSALLDKVEKLKNGSDLEKKNYAKMNNDVEKFLSIIREKFK